MTIEEHQEYGAALWFDELWYFYDFVEINGSWESRIQRIFSAISEYCPGYVDWIPKHSIIFSKLLRAMDLSVRDGKVSVGDGSGMGSESSGAEWIVWMLGGPNDSAERHLCRLIRCIESFLHPLHDGGHTLTLQLFLAALVNEMVRRVRMERVRNKTKHKVPKWMRLTDSQIESFVTILLPSVTYSAFSTVETSLPSNILRFLAFLAPHLVLPQVIDFVYPSFSNTTEPNRLKQSLECLAEVCVPLIRDDGKRFYANFNKCSRNWINEMRNDNMDSMEALMFTESLVLRKMWNSRPPKESIRSVQLQRNAPGREPLRYHAIVLLDCLVSAIDINDIVKLSLAFRVIYQKYFDRLPINGPYEPNLIFRSKRTA
ncbi:unnamed protein product [Anisakis simplex]|uniref:Proteasome activator complex subunit 4 (inferred by orthology to a human protein) n=1 Tax=Anisakis simplex TaxID=6269 RepID=A0A0M3J413_ANISI|nr:unnamed protein product [Anisakis simplex]